MALWPGESPPLASPPHRGHTAPLGLNLGSSFAAFTRRDLSGDICDWGCDGQLRGPGSPRRSKLPWMKLKGFFSKLSLRTSTSSSKVASEPASPVAAVPSAPLSVRRMWEGHQDGRAAGSVFNPAAPSPSGATSDCSGEDSGRLIVLDGSTVESPYLFGRRSSSFGPSLPPMVQQNQPQHMPRRHHAPPHRNLSHLSNTTTPRGSWDGRGAAILASPLPAGACVGGGPSPPLLPAGPAGRPGANAPAAATKQPPYHQSHMAASLMRSMGNFRGGGPHCAMPAVTAEPTSPLASPQAYLRASAGPSAILEPSAAPPSASAAAAQAAAGTTSTPHHYAAARPHADGSGLWRRAHQQAPAAAAARAHSSNLETLDRALTAIQRGGGVAQHPAAAGAAAAWTEAADPDAAASGARRARSSGCDPAASVSAAATSATGAPSSLLLAVSPALPSAMGRPVWSLDDYSISRRLYKGSSSAVYKATCLRSTLPVALKVYFLNRLPGNCLHMLKREIQINIGLVHKHVALLYGAFLERGEPGASAPSTKVVLVQEYAAHGDLYNVKQKLGGRIKAPQVANLVMRPLLEALAHMHSQGILHRDIKPANVLFTTDWRLLVADFGVSINLHQERAVTRAGTEGYMAPEVERCPLKAEPQENKDKPQLAYSTAVDIWAVGCMAYELMVGFPPAIMPQEQWAQVGPATVDGLHGGVGSGNTEGHRDPAVHFPATVPNTARDFICAAIALDPHTRPTATQLLAFEWLHHGDGVTGCT